MGDVPIGTFMDVQTTMTLCGVVIPILFGIIGWMHWKDWRDMTDHD
jgi:hypothetical protein